MPKRHFEDFTVGDTLALPERLVGRSEMIAFAAEFDPQPFHLDERAAAADLAGGLSASGWHVCALLMRMLCDAYLVESACMGSPGIDSLKWQRPVRPGDRLSGTSTVIELRPSASRPELGIVRFRHEMVNQAGAAVVLMENPIFFRRGGAGVIYEDFAIGSSHPFGAHHFTAAEIRRFALAYDPQPFHLDETAAKDSPFGAICASGWHTASVMMSLFSRYMAREDERARAAGDAVAPLGPSPGFDDLKWLRAVYPGDTVTFTGTVVAKRPSESRPGWGLVTVETTGINQKGERVFVVTGHVFAARRTGA